jgi:hypothetical protein
MDYQLLDKIKEILDSGNPDSFKMDDIFDLLLPDFLESDDAIQLTEREREEVRQYGYDDGRFQERDDFLDILYEMRRAGDWDEATLMELIRTI